TESPELGDRLCFDVAAQDENGESPSGRNLNPERHGRGALHVWMCPCCSASCPSRATCTLVQTHASWGFAKNKGKREDQGDVILAECRVLGSWRMGGESE